MPTPRFTKINEAFTCENCQKQIKPHKNSCRNHCTDCLYSKHLDINPGDRQSNCLGLMKPIKAIFKSIDKIVIVHKCLTCHEIKNNISAPDDNTDSLAYIMQAQLSN